MMSNQSLMMMMTTLSMIVEMMTVMHTGGVAVASDATFPAQLVVWPDLAGLAYLCASNTSTPNRWPLTAQLVGWTDNWTKKLHLFFVKFYK